MTPKFLGVPAAHCRNTLQLGTPMIFLKFRDYERGTILVNSIAQSDVPGRSLLAARSDATKTDILPSLLLR